MKKTYFVLVIILLSFKGFPGYLFSQGFFDELSPNNSSESQNSSPAIDQKTNETDSTAEKTKEEEPIVLLDRIKIRVNNVILTQRQFSTFYALRKLSPSLSKMNSEQAVQEELTRMLGLEAFAKANNLYNLLPTRNEMDNRVKFFSASLQVQDLAQAAKKIDPSGTLTAQDLRRFFYYQILREKGFVFALQKEFMGKIFTPREDEILLLYKQILASNSKIFQTPIQLYIRNIAIVSPANAKKKQNLIRQLTNVKNSIDALSSFGEKQKQFISAIKQYSSSHLKNTDIIGPLDEELVDRDFPEYKSLFKLSKGGTSRIIDQDGFIRLVFIDSKEEGTVKSVNDPDIRQRLTGIIYDSKGEGLFEDFLQNMLSNLDVQVIEDENGK